MANASKRILSIDVLRGITIVFMILVDDPAGKRFDFMTHPIWTGLTLADFIFPTFITLMGVSMYFSFKKYNFKVCKQSIWRVIRRFIVLLLFGWIVSKTTEAIPVAFAGKDVIATLLDFSKMRFLGIFTRLALSYLFGALIVLFIHNRKSLIAIIVVILVGYSVLLFAGNGFQLDESNIICQIDKAVFGADHLYTMALDSEGTKTIAFDPEGLLSTLPCIAQVLLGYIIGGVISDNKKDLNARILAIFIIGFSLLAVGYMFSFWVPAFKKAWTSTFTLIIVGSDACLLALLTWIIDVKGYKKWISFFRVYGSNALISFAAMDIVWLILAKLKITSTIYDFLLPICGEITGLATIITTFLFILVLYIPLYFLDKKKIYIRA